MGLPNSTEGMVLRFRGDTLTTWADSDLKTAAVLWMDVYGEEITLAPANKRGSWWKVMVEERLVGIFVPRSEDWWLDSLLQSVQQTLNNRRLQIFLLN